MKIRKRGYQPLGGDDDSGWGRGEEKSFEKTLSGNGNKMGTKGLGEGGEEEGKSKEGSLWWMRNIFLRNERSRREGEGNPGLGGGD